MPRELKAFIFSEEERKGIRSTITDTLKTYYKIINCDCIDIVTRKIGDKFYDFVVDEEGLLKGRKGCAVSFANGDINDCLCGTLVITGVIDEEGELTSLSEEDYENIENHIKSSYENRCFTFPIIVMEV